MAKLMRILTLIVPSLATAVRHSTGTGETKRESDDFEEDERLRGVVSYCEMLLTTTCDQQDDQKSPRPCILSDVDFCCIQLAALQEKDRCTAMKVVAERGRGGDGDVDVEKLLKMAREMPDVCNLPPYRCPW
ncbi:hypothetical protein L484_011890 [Morus notabilis]|uniref:Bifunctional inhibitor/plant lipid transfer protein/seed storage helical domain-containing protein n=1 Tax=Morus notabilis TaxID=981085 RepID=W9RRY3_9ROSA|nr:2S sulfur-rich seed storage protein 1 [Morus notabilis]EXC05101.1 hypothetical protein L484_011890 [Morus notabilis]